MAKAKKAASSGGAKPITDVAHPGTSAPSDTSKSIITPRPIMKDPMVVEDGIDKSEDTTQKSLAQKTAELNVTPPEQTPADDAKPNSEEPPEQTEEKPTEPDEDAGAKADDKDKKSGRPDPNAEAAAEAAKDAKLQQVIDSKKYFLPINAIEQRRNARFVALGVILVLLLVVTWVDIALDAGLIHLGGLKALTHFFSS
jgi:hypothetical protein